MSEQLISEIVAACAFVPGLSALSNVDFSQEAKPLDEKNWNQGVVLSQTPSGFDVVIAVFVSPEVRTKVIISELNSAIKNIFKKNKVKLNNILVNVRGIK